MNTLKRAIKAIIKNKNKYTYIFISVFILSNLLISAIIVEQSSYKMENLFKERIGSKVIISDYDQTILGNKLDLNNKERVKEDFDNRVSIYEQLKKEKDILYSSITVEGPSLRTEMPNSIQVDGVDQTEFYELFEKQIEITDGRTFTDEELELGSPVIVLNKELTKANFKDTENLEETFKVGDKIQLYISDGSENRENYINYEVTVIGLFDPKDNLSDENKWSFYTKMYMPLNTVLKQHEIKNSLNDPNHLNYQNMQMYFKISTVEGMDNLTEKADSLIKSIHLKVYQSSAELNKVERPLLAIRSLGEKQKLISFVMLIAVLSMITFMILKERRKEIGIYMALGERYYKIILQFLIEFVSVSLLAISLSLYSGVKIGQTISNEMLQIQIQEDAKSNVNLLNPENLDLEKMLEIYEFDLNDEIVMTIIGANILVLFISSIVPIIYIVNISPKKILM